MNLLEWLSEVEQHRKRTAVMGILNVTPDSFSDGGELSAQDPLKYRIEQMMLDGVDIFDIGGESTRPGAEPVELQEELDRVLPAIELIKELSDLPVSIDTYKPEVMHQALSAGASMVNDVNALQAEGAIELVAEWQVPVCLMHKLGSPKDMQNRVAYRSVVKDVETFLQQRVGCCRSKGIRKEQIIVDLGFGFGKHLEHNVALFKDLQGFVDLGYPVLVGVSRKKMIAELMNKQQEVVPKLRLAGSVAAATIAALKGAKIVRVHDVKQTVEALNVAQALW